MRWADFGRCVIAFGMSDGKPAGKVVFDFGTVAGAGLWQVVNDDVMGGVSSATFGIVAGAAVFEGQVRLENNGGFASVRSMPARLGMEGCEGLAIRVRGDGSRYKLTARTAAGFDGWNFQTSFDTKPGEWMEVRRPLADFAASYRGRILPDVAPPRGGDIVSLGFLISDRQAGAFRLEVAWIRAWGSDAIAPAGARD